MKYSCRILHAGMNLIEVLKKCYCIFYVFFFKKFPDMNWEKFWLLGELGDPVFFFSLCFSFFSSVLQLTLISVFYPQPQTQVSTPSSVI